VVVGWGHGSHDNVKIVEKEKIGKRQTRGLSKTPEKTGRWAKGEIKNATFDPKTPVGKKKHQSVTRGGLTKKEPGRGVCHQTGGGGLWARGGGTPEGGGFQGGETEPGAADQRKKPVRGYNHTKFWTLEGGRKK